jgi:hypothetical protein
VSGGHFELDDTMKCYTCSTSDTWTSDKSRVNWTSFLRGNGSVYHNRKLSTGTYVIDNINNKYPLMHVHNRGEFICSRKISSSCYTSDTRRVTQVTNHVINHEWGKDQEVSTTFGTHPWSFVRYTFRSGWPSLDFSTLRRIIPTQS